MSPEEFLSHLIAFANDPGKRWFKSLGCWDTTIANTSKTPAFGLNSSDEPVGHFMTALWQRRCFRLIGVYCGCGESESTFEWTNFEHDGQLSQRLQVMRDKSGTITKLTLSTIVSLPTCWRCVITFEPEIGSALYSSQLLPGQKIHTDSLVTIPEEIFERVQAQIPIYIILKPLPTYDEEPMLA